MKFAERYGDIEGVDEFEMLRRVLLAAKTSNKLDISSKGSPLYTLRPTSDFEQNGLLEFVVMTDTNEDGVFFTGSTITAEPHHVKVLAGQSTATPLYRDVEGAWISAAAPIRDSDGNVVGLVQADRYIAFYQAQIVESIYKLLFVAIISLAVGIVIAILYSMWFTRSINKLVVATQQLANGDLTVCLDINSGDEIEELSYHFNKMVKKLNRSMRDQKNKAQMLKQKNSEIASLNKSLENKVAKRTNSLQAANSELEATLRELQDSQAKLLQSEKMASLGQIAAGVAHEINNPIGFVGSNVTTQKDYIRDIKAAHVTVLDMLALVEKDDSQDIKSLIKTFKEQYIASDIDFLLEDSVVLLNETTEGIERVADIVTNLKTFSRIDDTGVAQINVNDCIDNTLKIVNNELKYSCTIHKEFGDLPDIMANAGELNQVLLNILINAGQAIEEQGIIEINTAELEDYITITIKDNGKGIPQDKLNKIFDPFFTTKPVGEGTGLGLAISYDIVKKHNGDIEVSSQLNQGTCFTIRLPKSQGLQTSTEQNPAVAAA